MRQKHQATLLLRYLPALATALGLSAAAPVASADEPMCRLHAAMPIERHLRKLSLVLRGHVPEYDEYVQVGDAGAIDEALIDSYLASDDFRLQMRRFHEQRLLTNPATSALRYNGMTLGTNKAETAGSTTQVWNISAPARRKTYRGGDGTHICQDLPQNDASLGYTNGKPNCKDIGPDASGKNVCLEGWVQVAPYWDPANKIKMCAFDAQAAKTYTKNGGTHQCNGFAAASEQTCGCGTNLAYCMIPGNEVPIWDDMREQVLKLVDDHATGLKPYSELITTKASYSSGRLDFFKKNLAPALTYGKTYNAFHKGDAPLAANPDWNDTTWHAETREAPHSGVLTLPAYTLRFQTNRARANRFRIAFMGEYFVPPASPNLDNCTNDDKNLTKRCYCRDCHRVLEPLAAHFAVVAEAGSGLLTDFEKVVYTQADCNNQIPPGIAAVCNRFYAQKTDPNDPTKMLDEWHLMPLQYAAADNDIEKNYDAGPEPLAKEIIADGTFARATVEYLFAFLVRREMNLDPTSADNEIALRDELATSFTADDNLPRLAKAIVMLDAFGRMP